MTASAKEIEKSALRLSDDERERIATSLLHSLQRVEPGGTDAAWLDLAEDRFSRLVSGEGRGMAEDEFFGELKKRLECA